MELKNGHTEFSSKGTSGVSICDSEESTLSGKPMRKRVRMHAAYNISTLKNFSGHGMIILIIINIIGGNEQFTYHWF